MNLSSKTLCIAVAGAALALTGCSKKPDRPTPDLTRVGQGIGPAPQAGVVDMGNQGIAGTGLEQRGATGEWAVNGQNRSLLADKTVYYDYDKSDIRPSEREKLKAAKEHLDKNPTHRLLLEGHCDWRGTAEYNLALGDRRAGAAKKYLQTLGVAAERLETLSKGSLEASKNADDATMAKDRRVDLIVVDPARNTPAAPAAFE